MPGKKKLELRQITQGYWVLDRNVLFTQMKEALIERDPLTKELLGKLMSYNPRTGKPTREETEELKQRIEKKWNVGIVETWAAQPHLWGLKPEEVTEKPLLIFNKTKGYPFSAEGILPFNYLLPINPSEGKITVQIDLNIIDEQDCRVIRDAVWKVVKEHLKAKKEKLPREPNELHFIYDIRQNTFDNYVTWYDLHTQEKLGFRAIAAWNNTKGTNPERATQVMEQLIHHKAKCHGPISGEDNIEHGVKIIYKAIHRVKYSRKDIEPIIEEYNCRRHGTVCPPLCTYSQKWLDRFNRLNPIQ